MNSKTLRITAEIVHENGLVESKIEVGDYSLAPPTTAAEIGLSSKEQLAIIQRVQGEFLSGQAVFLK